MNPSPYHSLRPGSFSGLIGISRADITPDIRIYSRNWGAAKHDTAEGIHQPLTLTSIVFQQAADSKPLVLIGADLGGWKNFFDERNLRGAIIKALDTDESSVMFCLSHTHAGPVVSTTDQDKPGGDWLASYVEVIRLAAIDTAKKARSNAKPAVLTWAYGSCSLATNRDLPYENNARYVVGFNPDVAADNTLLVGRITDSQDQIIGTIINYACHPTTLAWDNKLISPDYVGSMRLIVERETKALSLFLQGASGELSPAEQYSGDIKLAERNGRRLGYAVLETIESMPAPKHEISFDRVVESGAALAVWSQTTFEPPRTLAANQVNVSFPLKTLPSLAEIESDYASCEDRVIKERLFRKRGVRKAVGDGDSTEAPLWVWQIGDSFLVGQPNEAYSIFQQEVRRAFPSTAIAVMNLVNGGIAYLPPRSLYDKDIYQEWQTPFAAGSLELLTDSAIAEIRKSTDNE